MKKTVLYSLHGFIWFCFLCIIFFATLAGNLWVNENTITALEALFGLFAWSLAIFYASYSIIIPKLYSNRKYLLFIASIIGVSLISPLIVNADKVFSAITGNGWMGYSMSGYIQVFILCLIICTAGALLRIFVDWIDSQQKKKELEKEKLKSKLMVLIHQNNPHFIFNVLNNIDSLINTKPARASETINKLSALLRYIYTNSENDRVTLTSEIEYIENYIELQSLRFDNKLNVVIDKNIDMQGVNVVPMIFLPFIENAFKHGQIDKEHPIFIKLSFKNGQLLFECRNSYNSSNKDKSDSQFGLSNIIKRLDLMYPAMYKLNIESNGGIYSVSLTLNIDED